MSSQKSDSNADPRSPSAYKSYLTSLSLPQLLQEPATLASEASFLTSELTNLCHSQYQTFLSLHTASTSLSTSFQSFSTSLTALVDAVPVLEDQCKDFAKETKEMRRERRKVTTVLEQHEKLLDILEIPQLIDTCVKNGYYQEALDLASHTNALVSRFPSIPVIRSVEAEVKGSINEMHSQLLQLLQEPAKLPSLFKAVNFLRRMAVLDEEELALAFLTSRGTYMTGLFDAIERERSMDTGRFLKKWIDIWREGVYDIVTQYSSIFLDRPIQSATPSKPTSDLKPYLDAFTNSLIQQLLDILTQTIPQVTDSPALSSLLTQLSYCSSSFSRIGLDFRVLFPPIFEEAARANFKKGVEDACSTFKASIEKASGTRRGTPVRLPSLWMITTSAASDPPILSLPPVETPVFHPLSTLTCYPPLAIFINSILTCLNSLRLLAPLSSLEYLLVTLDDAFQETGTALMAYLQQSLSRQRRSFDQSDTAESGERENAAVFGISSAWFYVVTFSRSALVEGVYARNLREIETMLGGETFDWKPWSSWLAGLGAPPSLIDDLRHGKVDGTVDNGEISEPKINGTEPARSSHMSTSPAI